MFVVGEIFLVSRCIVAAQAAAISSSSEGSEWAPEACLEQQ